MTNAERADANRLFLPPLHNENQGLESLTCRLVYLLVARRLAYCDRRAGAHLVAWVLQGVGAV